MPTFLVSTLLGLAVAGAPATWHAEALPPSEGGGPQCLPQNFHQIPRCWFTPVVIPKAAAITSMAQLPTDVRWAFARDCGEFDVADVGADWNGTDVIRRGLPRRRLVGARRQGEEWIIEYARGGFIGQWFLAVFREQPEMRLVRGNCDDDQPRREPVRLPAYLGGGGRGEWD